MRIKSFSIVLAAAGALGGLVACEEQGAAESAGERIDDVISDAGERLEQAGEEAADAADEAAEEIRDTIQGN